MELNTQAPTIPMVVFRLALLCKAARALTHEIHHLVREYLVIRLGVISPVVDELLWRRIQETWTLTFTLSGSIPPEHRTVGPITGQRNIVYQKAANEGEEQITVYVHMSDKDDTAGSSSLTLPWNSSDERTNAVPGMLLHAPAPGDLLASDSSSVEECSLSAVVATSASSPGRKLWVA